MDENRITQLIIGCCIDIHNTYGPGLLESVYEEVLFFDLEEMGFDVERQKVVPIEHKGRHLSSGFRIDLLVDKKVLIELKSVERVAPVHKKQVLAYLKLTGIKLGLLINFNEVLLKNGITRIVNNLKEL